MVLSDEVAAAAESGWTPLWNGNHIKSRDGKYQMVQMVSTWKCTVAQEIHFGRQNVFNSMDILYRDYRYIKDQNDFFLLILAIYVFSNVNMSR